MSDHPTVPPPPIASQSREFGRLNDFYQSHGYVMVNGRFSDLIVGEVTLPENFAFPLVIFDRGTPQDWALFCNEVYGGLAESFVGWDLNDCHFYKCKLE